MPQNPSEKYDKIIDRLQKRIDLLKAKKESLFVPSMEPSGPSMQVAEPALESIEVVKKKLRPNLGIPEGAVSDDNWVTWRMPNGSPGK